MARARSGGYDRLGVATVRLATKLGNYSLWPNGT
jgi:hypothetical protein